MAFTTAGVGRDSSSSSAVSSFMRSGVGGPPLLLSRHAEGTSIAMLTEPELEALRAATRAGDPGLTRYLAALERRAAPLRRAAPPIPAVKALLSRDGGVCPDHGAPLQFDPWSPDRHRCPRCGREWSGDRHHRHWARAQHLWIAERAAGLALAGRAPGR